MTELSTNGRLTLKPATLEDKQKIFIWATASNLTSEMLGPPNFPDNPIPTREELDNDYTDHYFDGSQPLKGRCFVIEHKGQEIGQVNYNEIDSRTTSTELDIWLADKQYTGKGLGTEALKILCNYLDQSFDCKTIYIAPSRRNERAITSCKKAGFTEAETVPVRFVPDYGDTVLMIKKQ